MSVQGVCMSERDGGAGRERKVFLQAPCVCGPLQASIVGSDMSPSHIRGWETQAHISSLE